MKKTLVTLLAAMLLVTSCNGTVITANAAVQRTGQEDTEYDQTMATSAQENPEADSSEESHETTTDTTSGQCGYSAYWKLEDDGTLTISGSGDLYLTSVPWKDQDKRESGYGIKKVVIEEGITALPDNAFSGCRFLTEVIFPSSLTSIPSDCFSDCADLESIELPRNLTTI